MSLVRTGSLELMNPKSIRQPQRTATGTALYSGIKRADLGLIHASRIYRIHSRRTKNLERGEFDEIDFRSRTECRKEREGRRYVTPGVDQS